ncbi:hypothetical protein ACFZDK_37575 [Streptomyces sp. NPDC007901]|uniref:hypothetical protein n=1 Tax=Streptomyces sp. NPDC007901 TaxID=3364785 RepID=UPI0036E0BF34
MQWWQASLWGAAGALLVEAADLAQVLQVKNKLPWKVRGGPPRDIYLLASLLRTGMGVGVAAVLVVFGQVSGGFGAVLAGMTAPKIIEGLRRQTAVAARTSDTPGLSPDGGEGGDDG